MDTTHQLIEVEGAKTPVGGRDKGDPARLPDRPLESEAPGTEINRFKTTMERIEKKRRFKGIRQGYSIDT
ncbi:hypothetical protein AB685_12115 [Bacillus sp. LL01]|uniref:hypothetical protein n=1 Tax=Bacillus sp. LL01 TaxID=1665556 RepID=UPI00064D44CF|nr:hypothetical protein [Bacillus sp. LL01]KMJ58615.1 hypothetical protein AB685_12115 [Bacillus sp. LL01]